MTGLGHTQRKLQKITLFVQGVHITRPANALGPAIVGATNAGKKTYDRLRHYILKLIILPRQARDIHRVNSNKRCVFFKRPLESGGSYPSSTAWCESFFLQPFYAKDDHFAKTRSGHTHRQVEGTGCFSQVECNGGSQPVISARASLYVNSLWTSSCPTIAEQPGSRHATVLAAAPAADGTGGGSADPQWRVVHKMSFLSNLHIYNEYLTKTGSGQTEEKLIK